MFAVLFLLLMDQVLYREYRISHIMSISPQVNVRHCSQCQEDTEYHCLTCGDTLCPPCKRSHAISLDTKHHDVILYRGKFNYFSNSETCVTHSGQVYEMYCKPCAFPVCFHCEEHRQHKLQNVRAAYENKRKQNKDTIINIRSETLYNAQFLQTVMKNDVATCRREIVHLQSAMLTKSQILNDSIDPVLSIIRVKYNCLLIEKLCKQMTKMRRYLNRIQIYEHQYEQLAYRPVKFFRFIKKASLPQIQDSPNLVQHCRLSLTQEINMEDLIELLSEIQITEGVKRKLQVGNELLLTLIPSPVLQKSLTVKGVDECYHISFVTPDRVWVRDFNKLILTDTTTGDKLYSVDSLIPSKFWSGLHTVNCECELMYIDNNNNINKLSNDMKTTTTFIEKKDSPWESQCLYCSPSTGDLLVGMWRIDTETRTNTGKVRRYNNAGKLTQNIPNNKTPHTLYRDPIYITENNNGDVVVSDRDAVVVTDRGGRHRFSYTGPPPSRSELDPRGICTDALSHILVCDFKTDTVQMLNKDGEFLSSLLKWEGLDGPFSLSYDVNTHLLLLGYGFDNKVSVYRYINRHLDLKDGYIH